MTRPKAFRKAQVFGKSIPVFKVQGLLETNTYGYYDGSTKEIGVDERLKGDDLEHTVIHELFHATLDRLHCQQQMSEEFLEVVIENLAAAVIDNFRVKWKA